MKPIILIASLLTGCGSSGGGSGQTPAADTATATQTATATSTSTSTGTTTAAPTTKVFDIVEAIQGLSFGQPVSAQPAQVQALLSNSLTKVSPVGADTDVCKKGYTGTDYSTGGKFYSDGTEKVNFLIEVRNGVVVYSSYQQDDRPVVDASHFCP